MTSTNCSPDSGVTPVIWWSRRAFTVGPSSPLSWSGLIVGGGMAYDFRRGRRAALEGSVWGWGDVRQPPSRRPALPVLLAPPRDGHVVRPALVFNAMAPSTP